jgi:drug/metabolite transporter (DMT)-like permease
MKAARCHRQSPDCTYFKYFFALLLFGSNGIIADFIELRSCQIILLRTFLGSLLLTLIAVRLHTSILFPGHRRDTCFVFLSGVCMGISWLFQYEAYKRIGIGITSLLYCLGPILVVTLAQIAFHETMTLKKILCLSSVSLGAVLTGGVSLHQGSDSMGIFCALMCPLAYAGMICFNKKNSAITGLSNSVIQLIAGFITALVFNLVQWVFEAAPGMFLRKSDLLPMLILGFLNTGIGCYLYFSGISEIPAQTVAVCDYIEPLTSFILAAAVLHEAITIPQIGGAILIAGGTMIWNTHSASECP